MAVTNLMGYFMAMDNPMSYSMECFMAMQHPMNNFMGYSMAMGIIMKIP